MSSHRSQVSKDFQELARHLEAHGATLHKNGVKVDVRFGGRRVGTLPISGRKRSQIKTLPIVLSEIRHTAPQLLEGYHGPGMNGRTPKKEHVAHPEVSGGRVVSTEANPTVEPEAVVPEKEPRQVLIDRAKIAFGELLAEYDRQWDSQRGARADLARMCMKVAQQLDQPLGSHSGWRTAIYDLENRNCHGMSLGRIELLEVAIAELIQEKRQPANVPQDGDEVGSNDPGPAHRPAVGPAAPAAEPAPSREQGAGEDADTASVAPVEDDRLDLKQQYITLLMKRAEEGDGKAMDRIERIIGL